ncbi:MAG: prephenate dehydrogenase [Bacilli bacterium]|nr:prephenate dehydrogenase [Bacilli bacterium]
MSELPKKILIVGLGLMGGSYAMALSKKGYDVYAISKDEEDIVLAKKQGMIVDGTTCVEKGFVSSFSLIIFALYPNVLVSWLEENSSMIKDGTLLTDVTGVKCSIISGVKKTLKGKDVDFVFAHPMAGREKRGIKYADDGVFKKANFIVVPTEGNKEENIKKIELLGQELGCAKIARLSPDEHDEMIAYLSQLTHVIAVALMDAKDNTHLADYTGDSFRDLTRIAQINEEMWTSLFIENKKKLIDQMDLFLDEMKLLKEAIENEDTALLKEKMKESTRRRSMFALEEEKRK